MEKIIEYIKDKNLKYSDLLQLCKKNKLEETHSKLFSEIKTNCYFIYLYRTSQFIALFNEKVNLEIIDSSNKFYNKNIICNVEIFDYLKELNIREENIIINNDKNLYFIQERLNLHLHVKENKLLLNEIKINIPYIKKKKTFTTNIIKPKEVSEYFYDYFEYEKEREQIKYRKSLQLIIIIKKGEKFKGILRCLAEMKH